MPSYTPCESPPDPLLLGLSPNSERAFHYREETRFNSFSQQLQEEIDTQDNENSYLDHEEDEEEDPWQCYDEETDILMSPEEDFDGHSNYDEEMIFQIDSINSPKINGPKPKRLNTPQRECILPFWYLDETPEHLAVIVQQYNHIILKEDTPPCQRDCRRLPKFIGRIQRSPVNISLTTSDSAFHTLDKIDVYQRDIRPCGSLSTKLSTTYVLSAWNLDGIPRIMERLEFDQISPYRRKIIQKFPISFIYCLPVWQSKTEFKYSVEREEHKVRYAGETLDYTAYLPKDLMRSVDSEDMN